MADDAPVNIDVETLNYVLKLLRDELAQYSPTSPESIALWKFKEKLTQ